MAAAQLWLLRVFRFQFLTDAVQQLHVRLLRVFLKGSNESPGHGTCGLACDVGILSVLGEACQ